MNIYAKVGTMGQSVVRVKYIRKFKVGDIILIRKPDLARGDWIRCKIDLIKDLGYPLYYLSKI